MSLSEPQDAFDPRVTGMRIRRLRESMRLTQKELASRAGISVRRLRNMEHGRGNFDAAALCRVSDALVTSLDYLMLGRSTPYDIQLACRRYLLKESDGWFTALCSRYEYQARRIVLSRRRMAPLRVARRPA